MKIKQQIKVLLMLKCERGGLCFYLLTKYTGD